MLTINHTPVLNNSLGLVAKEILQFFIICNEGAYNTPGYKKYHNHFCKSFQDIEVYLGIKKDQAQLAIKKLESFNLVDIYKTKSQSGYRVNMNEVEALYEREEANLNHNIEVYGTKKKQSKEAARQRAKERRITTKENLQKIKEILKSFQDKNISKEEAVNSLKEIGIDENSDLYIITSACVRCNHDLSLADFKTIRKFIHDSYGSQWTEEAYDKLEFAIANINEVSFSKHFGTAVKNHMRGMRNFNKNSSVKEEAHINPITAVEANVINEVKSEVKEVVANQPNRAPAFILSKNPKQMVSIFIEYVMKRLSKDMFYSRAFLEAGYRKEEVVDFCCRYYAEHPDEIARLAKVY